RAFRGRRWGRTFVELLAGGVRPGVEVDERVGARGVAEGRRLSVVPGAVAVEVQVEGPAGQARFAALVTGVTVDVVEHRPADRAADQQEGLVNVEPAARDGLAAERGDWIDAG